VIHNYLSHLKNTHLGKSISSGKKISQACEEEAESRPLPSQLMPRLCKKTDLSQLHVLFKGIY